MNRFNCIMNINECILIISLAERNSTTPSEVQEKVLLENQERVELTNARCITCYLEQLGITLETFHSLRCKGKLNDCSINDFPIFKHVLEPHKSVMFDYVSGVWLGGWSWCVVVVAVVLDCSNI